MRKYIVSIILLLIVQWIWGQDQAYPYPSLSPKGKIFQTVGHTMVEIEYDLALKEINLYLKYARSRQWESESDKTNLINYLDKEQKRILDLKKQD